MCDKRSIVQKFTRNGRATKANCELIEQGYFMRMINGCYQVNIFFENH